jgi:hypothetical protein
MYYYKPSTKNIHLVTTSPLKGFAVTWPHHGFNRDAWLQDTVICYL